MSGWGAREAREKQALLSLALGRPVPDLPTDAWHHVFRAADRERLAAVIWARSASAIRAGAPPVIAEDWRRRALHISTSGARQLSQLRVAVSALTSRAITAIVLKGPPLAQRVYGDATLRPIADFDLHIALGERASAREALFAGGWRSVSGEPPYEEMFDRVVGGVNTLVEVHSHPLDEPMLSHVRFPLEFEYTDLGGFSVAAHSGHYLPGYLAAHLAKHELIPLLWIVDLHALWCSSSSEDRGAAIEAANRAGFGRHLNWALGLTCAIEDAAAGDSRALDQIEQSQGPVSDFSRVVRLMRLSPDVADATRVLAGRVWPPSWRGGVRILPRKLWKRAAGALYRRFQFDRRSQAIPGLESQSAIGLEVVGAETLLRRALAEGSPFWVRTRSSGMHPAVPPSALVRIVPVHDRTVGCGDIVLACLAHGEFVLQRIAEVVPGGFRLSADAADRKVTVMQQGVVGVCDGIAIGGRIWSPNERPRTPLDLLRTEWCTRFPGSRTRA